MRSELEDVRLRVCLGSKHQPGCHHTGPRARIRSLSNWEGAEGLGPPDGPSPEYWRGWNDAIDAALAILTNALGTKE